MRRLRATAIAFVILLLAVLTIRILMPRPRQLSEIARAVTPKGYSITGDWNQHLWLNDLECMALSNRGDRLAWLFDVTTMHTQSILGRALALLGVRDSHHLSLWTGRTDGTGIKLVGDLELEDPKSVSGAMSWAPDGKRVSFWANNKLWVIPVD